MEGEEQEYESNESDTLPGLTEWESKDFLCFHDLVYIPKLDSYFYGHWELNLGFPVTVVTLTIISYLFDVISIIPSFNNFVITLILLQTVLFILFLYSYLKMIIDGPGYFPFYWPLVPDKNDDESPLINQDDPSPSGIISTKLQEKWALNRERPNRCILSRSGRRIIVKPDHFCDWAQSWIGKRNSKFFLLFSTYGFFYLLIFLLTDLSALISTLKENPRPVVSIYLIFFFLSFIFLMLTGVYMSSHCQGMIINQTNWEEWNNIPATRYDKGFRQNIEDVCGSVSEWYLWPCPISPFTQKSNSELIMDYIPYIDQKSNMNV